MKSTGPGFTHILGVLVVADCCAGVLSRMYPNHLSSHMERDVGDQGGSGSIRGSLQPLQTTLRVVQLATHRGGQRLQLRSRDLDVVQSVGKKTTRPQE